MGCCCLYLFSFCIEELGKITKYIKKKNRDDDFSPALGCPPKKGKMLVELSKEKKTESASVELPSNRPSLGLEVKKDTNDSCSSLFSSQI